MDCARDGGLTGWVTVLPLTLLEKQMLNAVKKLFKVEEKPKGPVFAEWTPDVWKLEQYEFQFVFVPDKSLNGVLAEGSITPEPKYKSCYTFMPYTLWRKDLGAASYGIILPGTYRPTGRLRAPVASFPVRGAVWSIRPSQFILLDNIRQNGVQFERQRIQISYPFYEVGYSKDRPIPNMRNNHVTFPAWAYIGRPEYWDSQIGGVFASSQIDVTEAPVRMHPTYYQFE